ncbi:MAG: flagellar motor switch protein FliN [candidate division Zixibacteria bacterium]|nr:flagellar motor switch protein FliN [candidate division Zixibacteria bacterium]
MADEEDLNVPDESASEDQAAEQAEAVTPPESDAPDEGSADTPAGEPGEPAEEAQDSGDAAAVGVIDEGDAGDEAEPDPDKIVNEGDANEDDAEAAMLAMLEDLPKEDGGASPEDINFNAAAVSNAEFQQLSQPAGGSSGQNIDMLLDVNLPVSIELGRTKMSISDILALGPGSVVELAKLAGEPVDLLVNYKVVARGEVVVVDENFGVRVTQLLTPEERLKILGDEQ